MSEEYADKPHIVRLLPVLDEADVLEQNLRWWQGAGIPTIAVECGSSDASPEICRQALHSGHLIRLERLGKAVGWKLAAQRLLELAQEETADVVVLAGADEFFETEDGSPLREALEQDLAEGRTRMRFDVMEFCWSTADDDDELDVVARMRHYRHHSAASSFRAFVLDPSLDLSNPRAIRSAAPQKSSSRTYVNRHYPLRSKRQATSRVKAQRLKPFFIGSIVSPLAGVIDSVEALRLPSEWLNRHGSGRWVRRDGASRALLTRTATDLREARRTSQDFKRSLATLSRRYGELLLENERLTNGSETGASSRWYDQMYVVNRQLYDVEPRASAYFPAWRALLDRLPDKAAILEVGCGSGQLAQLLLQAGHQPYVGFDFSREAIDMARRRLPEGEFVVADARTTDLFESATYDVAVCTEVLEHVDDDRGLLRRVPPGVRVIATVPTFDSTTHLRFFPEASDAYERYRRELEDLTVTVLDLEGRGALLLLDGRTPSRP